MTAGRACRSSSSSFIALSSSLAFLPGALPALSGLPSSPSFFGQLHVTFNRGSAYSESASGLRLGHSAPNSGDDLLSEVYRVRFHLQMMHRRPTSSQHAVNARKPDAGGI